MTHPPGATLPLGGTAHAHPDLKPQLVPISTVTLYPGNPRRGDQDAITNSIRDLGLYRHIIVQRSTSFVLAGNHTTRALLDLGAEQVPVTWVDVDDTVAAALVARDNKTSDQGDYDAAELVKLITSDPAVLALSGYEERELDALHRVLNDLEFVRTAHETIGDGIPVADLVGPIDLDGDAEKVTVTLDPGNRPALYALLQDLPYVRNVTNAYVKQPADA